MLPAVMLLSISTARCLSQPPYAEFCHSFCELCSDKNCTRYRLNCSALFFFTIVHLPGFSTVLRRISHRVYFFFSCWELRTARKTRHIPNTWLYRWATSSLVENKSGVSGFCCFPLLGFAYAFSMKKSYFVFSYINLCSYHLETSFYIYYSDVGGPRTTGESQFSHSTVWVGSLNSGHQTR